MTIFDRNCHSRPYVVFMKNSKLSHGLDDFGIGAFRMASMAITAGVGKPARQSVGSIMTES